MEMEYEENFKNVEELHAKQIQDLEASFQHKMMIEAPAAEQRRLGEGALKGEARGGFPGQRSSPSRSPLPRSRTPVWTSAGGQVPEARGGAGARARGVAAPAQTIHRGARAQGLLQ